MLLERLKEIFNSPKFDELKADVRVKNYKNFISFTFAGIVVASIVLIFGLSLSSFIAFNLEFLILLGIFVAFFLFGKFYLKNHTEHIALWLYIAITPIMIMCILMGTFLDPTQPSITIMVFLCVLTIFILDKFWRIFLYITLSALCYTICCFFAKERGIFIDDMMNLIIFYLLAVGINYFTLSDKLENVRSFYELRKKSEIDTLTELTNRGSGVAKISDMILERKHGVFIIIDVDEFKDINDYFGHIVGDEYLYAIACALKSCFDENSVVMRLGGDEFAAFCPGFTEAKDRVALFDKIFEAVKNVEIAATENKPVTISLGYAVYDDSVADFNELYKRGDENLYQSKKSGKARYCLYD